jgi:LPS-assembly protein
MKRLLISLALLLAGALCTRAQFGSFGDIPIEITSESTRMESGLAIAENNVYIRYGETAIYCDYAQYNPDTRDVYLSGNVRIYRDGRLFVGERALYNLETKILNMADFTGESLPFRFAGSSLSTLGPNAYLVKDGVFTTSDSSKPDYTIRAKTVRIYPKDRIIFSNVSLWVGRVPIFWYPYLYQSLNQDQAFTFTPGYASTFGAYLLNQFSFPIGTEIAGRVRFDLYDTRGVGLGFDATWGRYKRNAAPIVNSASNLQGPQGPPVPDEKGQQNFGRFLAYFIDDQATETNTTALGRDTINPARYRITLQDRTYLAEDIYSTININKLSDRFFLEDFYPQQFSRDPNPDNMIAITKWDEDYTVTLLGRRQLNTLFDTDERSPELSLDVKRGQLFKSNFFYDSTTSVGRYDQAFASDSLVPSYGAFRADSYHQISYPGTYFGWLSIVPHVGVDGTYYSASSPTDSVLDNATGLVNSTPRSGGSLFRAAATASVEASFKMSRAYEDVQSHMLGLDGLQHVIQPYVDASFVRVSVKPEDILQFDQFNPSTELPPIDFPQFNTIDSLDNWSIIRLGVRNRLQTRRDDTTINWLELNTFLDINLDHPNYGSLLPAENLGSLSNLYNQLIFAPLPWVYWRLESQTPLDPQGYSEVNSNLSFMPCKNVSVAVGNSYIYGNKEFTDANLWNVSAYLRLNDHWGFSVSESYDFAISTLESQTYQISRDLSSWVASLGINILNNGGIQQITVMLTFTVKDAPTIRTPFDYTANALTNP